MSFESKQGESEEAKQERWKAEHTHLVESGKFDAPPRRPIKVGDMVAIKENNLIYQVYEVQETEAVVGYDLDDEHVRKTVPLNDIRDGAAYQNALLEQRGLGHIYKTTVEGNVSKLWDKTKEN